MKILVTGTRGVPDIPGGIEKHCQELYPRIAAAGHDILLYCRNSYVTNRPGTWRGIRLGYTFAPRMKSLEAIVHTTLCLVKALFHRPDLVHIHAIGPSLLVPIAKLLGFKVVMTHHGADYDRQKWGRAAKFMLKLGERLGGIFANEVIVISKPIAGSIEKICRRGTNLIFNGVIPPKRAHSTEFLQKKGIPPKSYILAVARFVPEKGLHDLIKAFSGRESDMRLVIAGDSDHETPYSRDLRNLAARDGRIVLTGYVVGEELNQLYSHAGLFVLPSYHEGLPIALLEALSYGLPVLVSDIPANLEVGLPSGRYFRCGDVEELCERVQSLFAKGWTEEEKRFIDQSIAGRYNWEKIAGQTIEVYAKVLNGRGPGAGGLIQRILGWSADPVGSH